MDHFRKHRRNIRRPKGVDGFTPVARNTVSQSNGTRGIRRMSPQGMASHRHIDDFRRPVHRRPATTSGGQSSLHTPPRARVHEQSSPHVAASSDARPLTDPLASHHQGIVRNRGSARKSHSKRHTHNLFKPAFWGKKRVIGAMATVLLLAGGLFGGRAWLMLNRIFEDSGAGAAVLQEKVDPTTLRGEGDGRVNILLIGRDEEGAGLTDTILIASINPIQKEAALLSIPRDLYIQANDGSYSKINAVFPNTVRRYLDTAEPGQRDKERLADTAGIKELQDVVQTKIGLPIHYYGMIDLTGFMKAIDTVGGININVPADLAVYDQMRLNGQDYVLDVSAGQQEFDGLRAMAYARSRYTSERGDFDRAERQRLILTALKSKILSAGTYSNPGKVAGLMGDFGGHIRTNLGIDEAMRLYDITKDIDNSRVASIGLADPPQELLVTETVDGQSVVVPRAGIENYREIQHFIRNRLRDGFLMQEDAKVLVLNGTSLPGLAARTSENLKSFGYNVIGVGDAPTQGYHTTMIVDLTAGEKRYTRKYLENRFFVAARGSLPDPQIDAAEVDFVIILGQNEQTRLAN